jgi:hypothetical protein
VALTTVVNLNKRSRINNGYIPRCLRDQAHRTHCEACHREYGTWVTTRRGRHVKLRQAIDHVFPRRWLLNFNLYANLIGNLVSVCANDCHPQKIRAENALFEGNAIGYVTELRRLNWPTETIRKAAEFYGLREVVSLLDREGRLN